MPDHAVEAAAADIVAKRLEAVVVPRDVPGAPPGTRDFDLCLNDGRVFALEITTGADRHVLSLQHQLARQNRQWASDKLASTWTVTIDRPAASIRPREVLSKIEDLLQTLETEGVQGFERTRPDEVEVYASVPAPSPIADAAIVSLREAGVDGCKAHSYRNSDGKAVVFLGTVAQTYSVSPDNLNQVVAAAVADNEQKLARATADERHLFIWVDWSIGAVGVDITSGRPPSMPPMFASVVDTVWVAFPGSGGPVAGASTLWRVSPPGAWEVLAPMV